MPIQEYYAPTQQPVRPKPRADSSHRSAELSTTLREFYGPEPIREVTGFYGAEFDTGIDLGKFDTLFGHSGPVVSVAFSPDGTRIAAGSKDSTVRVWHLTQKKPRTDLSGHSGIVEAVAFSGDGLTIASGSGDQTIRLWGVTNGSGERVLKGHTATVRAVTFSRDGKRLVSSSEDKTVRVWDLKTGSNQIISGQKPQLAAVAFSRGGGLVALSSCGGTPSLKLMDLDEAGFRFLSGLTVVAHALAFSLDGKALVAGLADNTVQYWNLAMNESRILVGHQAPVFAVTCSPDGSLVASGSADGTVRIWNIEEDQDHLVVSNEAKVWSVTFSPDGKTLAIGLGSGSVRLLGAVTLHAVTEKKNLTKSIMKLFK